MLGSESHVGLLDFIVRCCSAFFMVGSELFEDGVPIQQEHENNSCSIAAASYLKMGCPSNENMRTTPVVRLQPRPI